MTEIVWCCRIRPSSRQTLTFGCWQRAAAAPWSPAGWWRTGDARRHRLPTSPSNPVEKIQIKTQRWMLSGCRESFSPFISVNARNPQRWQDQGTSTECNNRKQTDRLAVHQLEDFGGPDDEYDGSCPHKVNNGVTLMSVRGNPSWNSWYSPTTEKMRVLVKCWYNESFTMFLRSFRRRVVWDRLMKM